MPICKAKAVNRAVTAQSAVFARAALPVSRVSRVMENRDYADIFRPDDIEGAIGEFVEHR